MRKSDREISDPAVLEDVINRAQVCRVAMCDGDTPYVVPMNFGYRKGRVYLHSAREGRKLDILRKNNRVCFEVDVDHELLAADRACGYGMRYRSVIAFGRAYLVEDEEEKRRGLDIIMQHYGEGGPHAYRERSLALTQVIRIDIESITCKANGY